MRDLWLWPGQPDLPGAGNRPAGDGHWDADWKCRVSVANIDQNGPFSSFPGIGRWFSLISSESITLEFKDRSVELKPGDPGCFFEGGEAPYCRLSGGPAQALNLMIRSKAGKGALASLGMLEPLSNNQSWWAGNAEQAGIFANTAGQLFHDGPDPVAIQAQSLVWSTESTNKSWRFEAPTESAFDGAWRIGFFGSPR